MFKLLRKNFFSFSLNNYNKSIKSSHIIRNHSQFVHDEYLSLQNDIDFQQEIIQKEKKTYQEVFDQSSKYYNQYYNVVSNRTVTDTELPELWGDYLYFSKRLIKESNERLVLFRIKNGETFEHKVLDIFDIPWVNKKQWGTASLAGISFSDDHKQIAFIIDLNNREEYTIGFKNIEKNFFFRDKLNNASQLKFSQDGKIVYYTVYNDKKRPYKIYKHIMGKFQDFDEPIFEQQDEAYFVELKQSQDSKYFLITSNNKEISEINVINRENQQKQQLICLISKDLRLDAKVQHAHNSFYFLVNLNNSNLKKLVKLEDKWLHLPQNELIQHFIDVFVPEQEIISEIDYFQDHIVVYLELEGVSKIKIIDMKQKITEELQLPEQIRNLSIIKPSINGNYITDSFRFHVDTALIYDQVYEYNFHQKSLKLVRDFYLNGKPFKSHDFIQKRVQVPSKDGIQIPLTLVYKKSLKLDRKNKCLLHGYGSYGINQESEFCIVNLSALENNWIIAFAHVRGGSEKGKEWHTQAMKKDKYKSFQDLIDCGQYLVSEGYTHPALLCGYGSSAGALLLGACMNHKPDLFKAVVLNVPFLDPLTALLDESLPLTQSDHEEFGNPIIDEDIFKVIHDYSPYQNIQDQEYPFTFIQAGINDFRSPIWMSLKYLLRFRDRVKPPKKIEQITDKNILLQAKESGHYGDTGILNNISNKCEMMAILEYVLLEKNKEISIQKKFKI